MNNLQRASSSIVKGYTIYLITSLVTGIIAGVMMTMLLTAGTLSAINIESFLTSNIYAILSGMLVYLLLMLACFAVMIYAMITIYNGLKKLAPQLDPVGASAVDKIAIGMLISLISSLGVFIPFAGAFLAFGGYVASLAFNITGYSELRKSLSLNELGKEGAKNLFQSIVFYLITIGCCITIIGIIAFPVFAVLYWVYLLKGWIKIRNSFAQPCSCENPNI